MEKDRPERQDTAQDSLEVTKLWEEPKLTFVEPKLTKHGELTEVTGQFFGAFSP
jgi:hypothetical protein